jgi:hypothetical protein
MDDVMTRMRDLASHKGDDIRRSKRDRSALKTTFRDLVASIEVINAPADSISLRFAAFPALLS